jgi:hypothetical protein
VDKDRLTQVGRALAQLGVEHIPAYSPQARGRSERAFRTLQDRLPKELALAGIGNDVEAANHFIREVYLPAHNARFAVQPTEAGSAFAPVAKAQWRDILCIQEERTVAPDNTVAWKGRRLQIPPHPARAHFVRAKACVHDYPDGELAIFHGPRRLVRWREGEAAAETIAAAAASPAFAPKPACGRRGQAPLAPSAHRKTETKAVNLCAT